MLVVRRTRVHSPLLAGVLGTAMLLCGIGVAIVGLVDAAVDDGARAGLRLERPALEAAIATSLGIEAASLRLPPMSDEDLVNSIVMNFDFDTVDRQLLIEQDGVVARARKLSEMLRQPPAATAVPRR